MGQEVIDTLPVNGLDHGSQRLLVILLGITLLIQKDAVTPWRRGVRILLGLNKGRQYQAHE